MKLKISIIKLYSDIIDLPLSQKLAIFAIIISIVGLLFGNNLVHQFSGYQQEYRTDSDSNIGYYNTVDTYPTYIEPTRKPDIKLTIGQTATSSVRQITVYSVKKSDSYPYPTSSSYINALNGNEFLIFDIEVKNIGSEKDRFDIRSLYVRDSDANTYEPYPGPYNTKDWLYSFITLYPDEHKRGNVAIQIPINSKGLILYYDLSSYPAQTASWTLPDQFPSPFNAF